MCGISGFCGFKNNYLDNEGRFRNILIKMREKIKHRGNDNTGEYLKNNVGLSQTRLTIRDLVNGQQPIIRNIKGNEYAIIYNGEIYNTDELKSELKKNGYQFQTTTDTEVILYGFIHYGTEFVKKLNGIFAFAIWDENMKKLFLFRDRAGIKPLFYTIKDGEIIFASEIKALFEYPEVNPEIDMDSMREIIGLGPARSPGCGVFKNINEINSGCIGVFSKYGFKENKYWNLESTPHIENYNETVEHVSFLVKDSVVRQMVSDVPVCTFLSGGVDSSIVTAIAAESINSVLNTFSFDFTENDIYFKSNSFQPERDKPYVDKVLNMYQTNHTYLECNEAELADVLYDSVDAKDLPGMADVDASLLYFCRMVKKHNKVTLTGECADEIFGGYPWFHKKEAFENNMFPWSSNLKTRTELFKNEFSEKLDIEQYVNMQYQKSINEVPYCDTDSPTEKRRREISYLNLKWFMTTLLDRMDRASMYTGLEARVPFADHRIIEYLWNVPWKYKCPNGVVKGLLRDSCKGLLSDEVLYRKKSPYPKTYNPKYEKILAKRLKDIVNDNNSPIQPIIDKNKILKFIETPSDYGKPWFGQLMAAPQLMAYLIQINYWLKKYNLSLNNL